MSLSGRLFCAAVQLSSLLTISLCAEAQQGQQTPVLSTTPKITVKADEVIVPVTVRNAQGESMGTLTKEDFQVFDDGKPQPLTGFSVVERAAESNSTVVSGSANNRSSVAGQPLSQIQRSVVFVFDDLNLSSSELASAQQATRKLLETSLSPSDMVAIVSTSGTNSGLTGDRAKLQQAVLNLKAQTIYHPNQLDCPNIDYYQADLILDKGDNAALNAAAYDAMVCAGLPNDPTGMQAAVQLAQQAAHRANAMGEQNFRSNLNFLRLVISKMAALPGQHIVILISPGFLTFSEEAAWLKSQLLDVAAQANVTINAIDAQGLYTTDLEASKAGGNPGASANKTMYRQKSALLNESVMAELTDGTGGVYFHNSNALESGLNSLFVGPAYLYLLSFSIDKVKPNGMYHSLKVKVKPDGLTVQARRGYVAPKHEKTAR
jgi:VWFA-related protein